MKKKNNCTDNNVSFEDFEQAMMAPGAHAFPVDDMVRERLNLEKETRKKQSELKKRTKSQNDTKNKLIAGILLYCCYQFVQVKRFTDVSIRQAIRS
jgi:hypothetical protein